MTSGTPLYYSWSPDPQTLLLHVGQNLFLYNPESGGLPEPLNVPPSLAYRTSAWSPDGQHIAFLSEASGDPVLTVANADGSEPRPLATAPNHGAFLWSPRGDVIALSNTSDAGPPHYVQSRLVNVETGEIEQLALGPVAAFFWSPAGDKLAYIRIAASGRHLALEVVDVDSRTSQTVAVFVPSVELVTLFTFFDQYTYSNLIWSPDGTHLVFAGALVEDASLSSDQSQIYVVDVSGETPPRAIAQGTLAFWSTR